jgi:hypothetical protein
MDSAVLLVQIVNDIIVVVESVVVHVVVLQEAWSIGNHPAINGRESQRSRLMILTSPNVCIEQFSSLGRDRSLRPCYLLKSLRA